MQIGIGIFGIFGTIFFYEKFGNSILKVLVLYALHYFLFVIVTHVGAKLIGRIGMKKMMIIAVLFFTLSVVSRFMWEGNPALWLVVFFFAFAVYKMLYWIPYHVEFASFTDKKMRGKQMAVFSNVSQGVLALTPLIGGFILSISGYEMLFLIASVIIFISVIPLFYIKETKEKYVWSAPKLVEKMLSRKYRGVVVSEIGNGVQNAVGSVVWPIFIFLVLDGDYLSVGAISSITIVAIIALGFVVGTLIDKWGRARVLKIGSALYTTGWIFKVFVGTGFGVFLSDIYHNFGKVVNKLSFDTSVYDHAADEGHFIDEITVLKETSLLLGKGAMFIASIFIISMLGITATFLFAAIASIFMTLITREAK